MSAPLDLAAVRTDAEELAAALARARHEADAGTRPVPALADACRGHAVACSADALSLVREAREAAEGRRAQRLQALSWFLFQARVVAAAAAPLMERARLEASATVADPQEGGAMPLRTALTRLPAVADRSKRHVVEHALALALAPAADPGARVLEAAAEVAARAGFASLPDAHASLAGIDLQALAAEARAFLDSTDAVYRDVFEWWVRRTTGERPFPHGALRHDWLRSLFAAPYEGLFPRGDVTKAVGSRLVSFGIDPLAGGRVRVDAEERPQKSPRPFVAPLEVPQRIVAGYRPVGGALDARSFLLALGRARHYASLEEARPFEDRCCGDTSVNEAFGNLFALLLCDRGFLRRAFAARDPDLVRVLALGELGRARRDAALLLYGLELATEGPGTARAARFEDLLSRATLARWPSELYLAEVDPFFEAAGRLRGRALEAVLFAQLLERFDEDWWANPRAQPFLAKISARGLFEPAHKVAEEAGAKLSVAQVGGRLEKLLAT